MKAFNPQNRPKFPANRESLQISANNIIKILDENSRLSNQAVATYEQAAGLMTNEQQRRGTTMAVSALKTSLQIDDLFKSQVQLVFDEKIVNEKTFNERFLAIANQIREASRIHDAQLTEGKRLLGL